MGRVYSGRNAENPSAYKRTVAALRGRTDVPATVISVLAMYSKAADEPGKAQSFRAQVADTVAELSTADRAQVNAILSEVGIGGLE